MEGISTNDFEIFVPSKDVNRKTFTIKLNFKDKFLVKDIPDVSKKFINMDQLYHTQKEGNHLRKRNTICRKFTQTIFLKLKRVNYIKMEQLLINLTLIINFSLKPGITNNNKKKLKYLLVAHKLPDGPVIDKKK